MKREAPFSSLACNGPSDGDYLQGAPGTDGPTYGPPQYSGSSKWGDILRRPKTDTTPPRAPNGTSPPRGSAPSRPIYLPESSARFSLRTAAPFAGNFPARSRAFVRATVAHASPR